MNDLIKSMSEDMKIMPYTNETQDSFIYRLIFSGLGQWCIQIADKKQDGIRGITKHYQTIVINNLLNQYIEIFPFLKERLYGPYKSLPVFFRRIYEETGYLLTDENNKNHICNYGRTISVGELNLFFGIQFGCEVNGLGTFTNEIIAPESWRDFLIRDKLTPDQYIKSRFNIVEFSEIDIQTDVWQYFNPLMQSSPSKSWKNKIVTEFTVGRKGPQGPFYLILTDNNQLLYSNEETNSATDKLTSYEYRRLYYSLKSYYKSPARMWIQNIDNLYSRIALEGHLPNREYYLFLLISWPLDNAWNKKEFIIKNEFIPFITEVVSNIGIKVLGG